MLMSSATAGTSSLLATDDNWINMRAGNTGQPSSNRLRIDGAPVLNSYLRFSVTAVSTPVTKAVLQIFSTSSGAGGTVSIATGECTESTLSLATVPTRGATLGATGAMGAVVTANVDVSAAVQGNGVFTFVVTSLNPSAQAFASSENPTHQPKLIITTAVTPSASPSVVPSVSPSSSPGDPQPSFPIRASFYYPWFPESWNQQGFNPFTNYTPSAGFYDSSDSSLIATHIAQMRYAGLTAGIASW